MLFNSSEFIFVFLPFAVLLHFALARWSVTAAVIATTLTSLLFYAWWNPPFVLLPVLSIACNFLIAQGMRASGNGNARALLIVGIVANLAVLGWFKYGDFLLSIFEGRKPHAPDVPLALSFTTFVQIAFLVDVFRRRGAVNFPIYAMFVAFFPHLIAGPIVRWEELGPQLRDRARYRPDWNNIALGLTIFTLGLAKKVLIADKLAPHIGPVFDAAARGEPLTAFAAWGAAFGFSAQIYFDFSGYSDMAVGLGLLFNLRLPVNFAAPFRSTNVIDLWRRWHASLARFMRDFVFMPLGGRARNPIKRLSYLVATLTIGGLWHGANWTYITWGALNGVAIAINHAWRMRRGKRKASIPGRFAGWCVTFLVFVVTVVFFRAADIESAAHMIKAMAGFGNAPPYAEILHVGWDQWGIRVGYISETFVRSWLGGYWSVVGTLLTAAALAIAFFIPDTVELVDYREGEPYHEWRRNVGMLAWQPSVQWILVLMLLFVASFANILQFTEFLYYQF